MSDEPAVSLELRFAGTAHANATAEFLEVCPHPRQSRQHVVELRQLNLHPCFAAARAGGENVENQLRTIHHPLADDLLDVLALRRTQFVVEEHERRVQLVHALAQLVQLSAAEIRADMRFVDLLRERTADFGTGSVRQSRELSQVLVDLMPRRGALARRTNEQRPFGRRCQYDRITCDDIPLLRAESLDGIKTATFVELAIERADE